MSDKQTRRTETPARRSARIILIISALLLPTLSLVPLGGMYLWDKGWLLWWALGALVAVGIAVLMQRSLLSQATQVAEDVTAAPAGGTLEYRTRLETLAWSDVRSIATNVDIDKLDDADAIIALGQKTVDAVARRLHPEKPDAVWRFTLPQALAISERVSARLGKIVDTRIPFGDRLTVAQLLSVYGWRRYIGVAEQAYDIWRVIRMANPATAVTHEARERLSRALMNWGKEHVSRRIAEAFVEEVGRAAIDLYSGRLPTGGGGSGEIAGSASAGIGSRTPSSVVVVGADQSGRVELAASLQAVFMERAATGSLGDTYKVIVSDAITARDFGRRQLTREVSSADVVVWAVSAATGPSAGDTKAIAELRRYFVASAIPVPPAVVAAATIAPIGSASDRALDFGDLAAGFATPENPFDLPPSTIVAVAATGDARVADIRRLADNVTESIARTAALREAASQRTSVRRGAWASAGQAATAVGGLAGALLKPRTGITERDR